MPDINFTRDYIKFLEYDTAQQFRVNKLDDDAETERDNKNKIRTLLEVLGEQLDDVFQFFNRMKTCLWIDSLPEDYGTPYSDLGYYVATGKQLDGIGDLVVLSRDEAKAMYPLRGDNLADDEVYRRYLKYKIVQNYFICTYYDVRRSIQMFWRGPTINVSEDPEYPARIILSFDEEGTNARDIVSLPLARGAGIGLLIRPKITTEMHIYSGVGMQVQIKAYVDCGTTFLEDETYLIDNDLAYLTTEDNELLVDNVSQGGADGDMFAPNDYTEMQTLDNKTLLCTREEE